MISDNIKEFSVAIPDTKRPELKNLHHLFKDDFEKDGNMTFAQVELDNAVIDLFKLMLF